MRRFYQPRNKSTAAQISVHLVAGDIMEKSCFGLLLLSGTSLLAGFIAAQGKFNYFACIRITTIILAETIE